MEATHCALNATALTQLNATRSGSDVFFTGDITHASCFKLAALLREAEQDILTDVDGAKLEMQTKKRKFSVIDIKPQPVRLFLTTYGGSVHAAFSVVDTILTLKVPVHTYIMGYVASAGTLISISGAKRFIFQHARALLHEVRTMVWGKYTEVQDHVGNTIKSMDLIAKFYARRTKLGDEDALRELLRRDVDWDATECVKHGVADEIVNEMVWHDK